MSGAGGARRAVFAVSSAGEARRRAAVPVGLSSASVWPQPVGAAFAMAAELGYDGVELMVWADPVSQDVRAVARLAEKHGVPVLSVHAPCLLITQRVWSADPEVRLDRAVSAAVELGAPTVVVHPPFRWQRRYAENFPRIVDRLEERDGVRVAVENMFPMRPLGRRRPLSVSGFRPSPDPTDVGYANYTLDLSHCAAAHVDALELAKRMGGGLAHVHLADGTGAPVDEHLVPGRGTQPCAELCEELALGDFDGAVVLEVNTRKARDRAERARMLAESLAFARRHLARP
ncbi:sugar phosphate isomerase/epimerase family protein [Streptoalloteichus hindustanus]|uniref:Sugar phosphate isomerase/epimerase n=1 Tax=Streptoalloteichus hindustanus TaxID=2017 RepID=A0A1M4TYN9_STRHI|nr:sugar phosphate isomerase/epimerase family protein [Streptoalloteichus hindustanus]SHE49493.1 Sugar phosphate isomerase/epimerase [Streptoalloteichus hindustanus]